MAAEAPEFPGAPGRAHGMVVALEANFCRVWLEAPGPAGVRQLLCVRRTRLGKTGQQICVGDRVGVEGIDWSAARGAVAELGPRRSLLGRPAVANCSRVVVVTALAQPQPDPLQVTRFLLTAERSGVAVDLVLTKADLLPPGQAEQWRARVAGWGYPPLLVSTLRREGLEALRHRLEQPGIAVLCGPSGVGKSSLLNALIPALDLRVGRVSGRLQRGRHTTRHVELFPLGEGALLADTPGFNRPDLPVDPADLAGLFPEIRERLGRGVCRYKNCLHQGDPGCVVAADWDRYPLYLQCLEASLAQASLSRERSLEPGLKQRGSRREPRLDQRLRQPSRRRQRQGEPESE